MAAAWYRARSALRRRWRSALVLVLLVGLAGGALLTVVAGARRSSSAYDRFRQETLASDLELVFDGPPRNDLDEVARTVRDLPEVAAVGRMDFPFIVPAGSGDYPYLDFLAAMPVDATDAADIDRPRILSGRSPDPTDPREIAVTEVFAREADLDVGDEVEFESFSAEQLEPLFTTGDAGPPAGPRFRMVVTGIFDAPILLSESSADFQPRVFLSSAFGAAHGGEVATYPGGFSLRLHRGEADVAAVTERLREMFADSGVLEIPPSSEIDRKIDSSVGVIVTALVLCALVVALAGTVAVAQALTRHLGTHADEERPLAALGMAPRARIASQAAMTAPVVVLGAVLAVGLSVLASPLMPVGVARRAEPDPGISVDWPVLALGFVGIAATVVLLSVLAALSVTRRANLARTAPRAAGASGSTLVHRSTRLAPPATIGVRMALDPRAGTAWAVRSAVLGVAFAVAGTTAVVVFVASADRLVSSPDRYGSPFDAMVSGFSGDVLAEGGDELLAGPDVAAAGLAFGGLGQIGGQELNTLALEPLKGDVGLTVLDGHGPRRSGEVVLGPSTVGHAGVELGDTVEVDGAARSLQLTVVGVAVFPVVDERSSPGRGALLWRSDFETISAPEEVNSDVLVAWADGVDAAVANTRLGEVTGTEVFAPRLPSDVRNLREVEMLPRALAGFLALLGLLATVHALVSTVRMRKRDLAVLRTLGFVGRQLGATLVWQATVIGLVGLLVGVPLGLAVGQGTWRALASDLGVVDDPEIPALSLAIGSTVALVVVIGAAVLPGRAACRVQPGAELRPR